ncbi:hypothetical protein HanIR_Chr15g0746771 [Helianthus annuus]|nr:hypothetical protein HanIR_Chr15g0746771 [Helianthus annuus]
MLHSKSQRFRFRICSQSRLRCYFLGYFSTVKAYKVFNIRTMSIEETMNLKFNELSSLKIHANPAELFDLYRFDFEDVTTNLVDTGVPKDVQQDYKFDIMIPSQCKIFYTPQSSSSQSTYQTTTTTVDQSQHQTIDQTSGQTTDPIYAPHLKIP